MYGPWGGIKGFCGKNEEMNGLNIKGIDWGGLRGFEKYGVFIILLRYCLFILILLCWENKAKLQ
jgi:hypothetical protein